MSGMKDAASYNTVVRNPWSELPAQTPYVLQIDRTSIEKYNTLHISDDKIAISVTRAANVYDFIAGGHG